MGKLSYDIKYTLGSYADLALSMPILAGKAIAKTSEFVANKVGYKNPDCLNWDNIEQRSETCNARKTLRDKLDTRPGNLFHCSNLVALAPFYFAGSPVADFAADMLKRHCPDAPEIAKCVTNSAGTIAGQFVAGYTTYMVSEVALNKQKFVNELGKVSPRKVWDEFKNAAKAFFFVFDAPYATLKLAGQSFMISQGQNPGIASEIFDQFALPTYFAVCNAMGLHKRMIITNKSDELFPEKKKTDK